MNDFSKIIFVPLFYQKGSYCQVQSFENNLTFYSITPCDFCAVLVLCYVSFQLKTMMLMVMVMQLHQVCVFQSVFCEVQYTQCTRLACHLKLCECRVYFPLTCFICLLCTFRSRIDLFVFFVFHEILMFSLISSNPLPLLPRAFLLRPPPL